MYQETVIPQDASVQRDNTASRYSAAPKDMGGANSSQPCASLTETPVDPREQFVKTKRTKSVEREYRSKTTSKKKVLPVATEVKGEKPEGAPEEVQADGGNNISQAIHPIPNGDDIDEKDDNGCTALHKAASEGHVDLFKFLIQAKADVNAKDNNGNSVAHYAVKQPNPDIFKILLDNNIDVTVKNHVGDTILHEAVKHTNKVAIKMLLSNDNVNLVNEKNTDEYTPFHLIASRKPKNAIDKINIHNIARFLVQKGADFLARDTFGWTALTLATQYKNFDMQEQLSNIEIYGRNRPYLPPTKIAIEAGDITALQSLITAGTKLEYVDIIFGIVAAGSMFASDQKYEVLEFILREGKFDINTPESGAPCLPIHIAIEGQNDPKALQILIKYGARVNIPNSKGLYPIDMAAVYNNFDIAKILINNGAKVHNHLYTINMAIKIIILRW